MLWSTALTGSAAFVTVVRRSTGTPAIVRVDR
jgi:hypothetical protein